MNAKHFTSLTLVSAILLTYSQFAMGSGSVKEPFSTEMKRVELIFIGTIIGKQYAHNEVTNGFVTDFTFNVDKLIEGEPNINDNTVIFCIPGGEGVDPQTGKRRKHWNSMGEEFSHLEIGERLILFLQYSEHIAQWTPRRDGLYPVHSWTVNKKKIDGRDEFIVYFWSNSRNERLKHHFLGIPLSLFVELIDAARNHPDVIDPLMDIIGDIMSLGIERGIRPDTREADIIQQDVVKRIKLTLAPLKINAAQQKAGQ